MKNMFKLFGIIAAVAIVGLSVTGCPNTNSGNHAGGDIQDLPSRPLFTPTSWEPVSTPPASSPLGPFSGIQFDLGSDGKYGILRMASDDCEPGCPTCSCGADCRCDEAEGQVSVFFLWAADAPGLLRMINAGDENEGFIWGRCGGARFVGGHLPPGAGPADRPEGPPPEGFDQWCNCEVFDISARWSVTGTGDDARLTITTVTGHQNPLARTFMNELEGGRGTPPRTAVVLRPSTRDLWAYTVPPTPCDCATLDFGCDCGTDCVCVECIDGAAPVCMCDI